VAVNPELLERLQAALRDDDVFRVVIRGFAVLEDALEGRIREALVQPLAGIGSASFRRKLDLAVALGFLEPAHRPRFQDLATLRNDLTHGKIDPETVTAEMMEALYERLQSQTGMQPFAPPRPGPAAWAGLAIATAFLVVESGATVARQIREAEQEALRRALSTQSLATLLGNDLARAAGRRPGSPRSRAPDDTSDAT